MRASQSTHDQIADLLAYPAPERIAVLGAAIDGLGRDIAGATTLLAPLRALFDGGAGGAAEELFCATFDNSADRALEVGWQLFGENYNRGACMVRMRELMRELGIAESSELPDHLSHVLRVVARLEDDRARELIGTSALPATQKIIDGFDDDAHPYRGVIRVAQLVLESHIPEASHV